MSSVSERVFCAFCKLPRRVYTRKNLSWTNVLLSLVLSFLLMFGIWQRLDGRVTIFFAVSVILAEVFVYIRWRLSVRCPHCHFDPVLYKSDRKKTVIQVRERLEELKASGGYLLKHNNPFTHLPTRPAPVATDTAAVLMKDKDLNNRDALLSRQV